MEKSKSFRTMKNSLQTFPYTFPKWVLLLVISNLLLAEGVRITLITIIIGDNPTTAHPAAAPFYDVSLTYLRKEFPNVFQNFSVVQIYKPVGVVGCQESADMMNIVGAEVFGMITDQDGLSIIFTADCSLEIVPLGDYARELDVLLVASSGADNMLANSKRFPTLVTFGPAGQGHQGPATRAFLQHFGWTTVTVFCDAVSQFPSLTNFCAVGCRAIRAALQINDGFDVAYEAFDSAKMTDFSTMLLRAHLRSRIFVVITREDIIRNMLVTAVRLGLANSENVYIYVRPILGPSSLDLTWKYDDWKDPEAEMAFRSLIVMQFISPNWDAVRELTDQVYNRSRNVYNHTYKRDEKYNDVAMAIFEGLFATATVLNETISQLGNATASALRRKYLNRTFKPPSRSVTVGPNGMRISDTIFLRLNLTAQLWEPVWYYNFSTAALSVSSDIALEWPGGSTPLNRPRCGYAVDVCATGRGDSLIVAIPVTLVFVVLCSAAFFWIIRRTRPLSATLEKDWWKLESSSFLAGGDKLSNAVLRSFPEISTRLTYNGKPVWSRIAHSKTEGLHTAIHSRSLKLLQQIRRLDQKNLSRFNGLLLSKSTVVVVWDLGRATIHTLLVRKEGLLSNESTKKSLIFDVIRGLVHIHSTPVRYHGSLSNQTIAVDNQFTAKICDTGSDRMIPLLTHASLERHAPPFEPPSPFADVFAMGVVVTEILLEKVLGKTDDVLSELPDFIQKKSRSKDSTEAMFSVASQCLGKDPKLRPRAAEVWNRLSRFRSRKTVVEEVLIRLETYATNLEIVVGDRTASLIAETKKTDALLAELIPPSLVAQMRNKQHVPAETFDCASLMFSSIVGFDGFCHVSGPVKIATFLNELYSFLDHLFVNYDVYKLETIKDNYVVVSGLPVRNGTNHAREIAQLALTCNLSIDKEAQLGTFMPVRIGIHSGPCAAAIVGSKMPRYCLFGDAMNTASRMETHGEAGRIHVSSDFKSLLDSDPQFCFMSRGLVEIKGKGAMATFWLSSSPELCDQK